ncbi:hypothetical protein DSO57_1035835 [Entomophthora muscae]|uniref:Uncharacterized protein n=1 Tax=Entomophthora muscae TaxID=34485 RepID=A0ACC2TY30_9FUNG|nr:hypothetical protein DSO57_1035835 [Entomophthora muscae]
MILQVWYTATPLSHNSPLKEKAQMYQAPTKVDTPTVLHPLASAFLLSYLGAYFFLGCFNPLLGQYRIFGELFHLGMVSLPVGSLVTGLNPAAIIHHLRSLLPSGWLDFGFDPGYTLVASREQVHHNSYTSVEAIGPPREVAWVM